MGAYIPAVPGYDKLTPRERAAAAEIVRGASNKETGRASA